MKRGSPLLSLFLWVSPEILRQMTFPMCTSQKSLFLFPGVCVCVLVSFPCVDVCALLLVGMLKTWWPGAYSICHLIYAFLKIFFFYIFFPHFFFFRKKKRRSLKCPLCAEFTFSPCAIVNSQRKRGGGNEFLLLKVVWKKRWPLSLPVLFWESLYADCVSTVFEPEIFDGEAGGHAEKRGCVGKQKKEGGLTGFILRPEKCRLYYKTKKKRSDVEFDPCRTKETHSQHFGGERK